MTRSEFEALVRTMAAEVPTEYFDGVTEVVVSPRAVPHPTHADVYTLGECLPLPLEGEGPDAIQSRVVLYHGSFRALAEMDPDFSWIDEAWDTLTHELRHHVEWRARREDLEAFDRAAEQNFLRHEGGSFDPLFFLDGDQPVPGVYRVDPDWFLDHRVRSLPADVAVVWHGRRYRVAVPRAATLPAYLQVAGVREPPIGDLVVVLRQPPRLTDLFRSTTLYQAVVEADEMS